MRNGLFRPQSLLATPALVLGLILAPSSSPLWAQDAGAERQAYLARLAEGIERLAFLDGRWTMVQETPDNDGNWQEQPASQLSILPSMNGLYLETEISTGPYVYRLVFSYDAAQGRYRIMSRDDQSGLLDIYEGNFDETGALVVSNIASGTHYSRAGIDYHNRMTFTPDGDSGWTWIVELTADDGATWRPQVRVAASPAP